MFLKYHSNLFSKTYYVLCDKLLCFILNENFFSIKNYYVNIAIVSKNMIQYCAERIKEVGKMIRPLYKLKKCPKGIAPGKYSASVVHENAMGTTRVVQEAIDYCGLHISPYLFESVVAGLLESMIHHTLQDGMTRRFGDYFELQLGIKGSFDSQYGQFDSKRHKIKLTMRPLKKLRDHIKTATPENKVKPPCPHIDMVRSVNGADNVIVPGEDIVVTGRNLKLLDTSAGLYFSYAGIKHRFVVAISDFQLKENTPTRLVVPYDKVFHGDDDISPSARSVRVSITSEGGLPNGRNHTHKYRPIVTVQ